MTKEQLIKLIHIAKGQLKLDEDTYRSFLLTQVKKDSCSKMRKYELEKVYDGMKARGFVYTGRKKGHSKPAVKVAERRGDINKIKAIWITMGQQGFIGDTSDKALDAYVDRMTKAKANGLGIKTLAWLDGELAYHVLESIKQWHLRLIIKHLLQIDGMGYQDKTLYFHGDEYRGYNNIAEFYKAAVSKKRTTK